MIPPVENFPVSQYFGENPEYYGQWGLAGHNGIDYACPVGTPVYAPTTGMIVVAYHTPTKIYGKHIVMTSADLRYRIILAHLSSINVSSMDTVHEGELIAYSGNTGNSTGPHLHFGVFMPGRRGFPYDGLIDPLLTYAEGDTMRSKMCFHIQLPRHEAWLKAAVAQSGMQYVKLLDPDRGEAQPYSEEVTTLGRLTFPNNADAQMVLEGVQGAQKWLTAVQPRIRRCPWIDIWELPNEPVVRNGDELEQYISFSLYAAKGLRQMWSGSGRPFGITAAPFSTGNPPDWVWPRLGEVFGRPQWSADERAKKGCVDYGNTHEYGMKSMVEPSGAAGQLYRYRTALRLLASVGWRVPQWFISETGIDYHGNGYEDGWRKHTHGPVDFLQQLASYDLEVSKDPEILAFMPFTHMAASNWPSFSITQSDTEKVFVPYLAERNKDWKETYGEWLQQFVLPRNVDSAFAKYAAEEPEDWDMMSPEVDRDGYRFQVWYCAKTNMQHILYARIGDWGNIQQFERKN